MIRSAYAKAWQELLVNVSRDPWGRSYRFVLGHLRATASLLNETVDRDIVDEISDSLFPQTLEEEDNRNESVYFKNIPHLSEKNFP